MATSWPKSLDTMYGSAESLCQRVAELTEGKFTIQPFAGRRDRAAAQVFDAVQNGTIECGHALTSFFFGKNPAIAFDAGVAFGLNSRQQAAWMYYGGGLELMREVFSKAASCRSRAAMSACRWAAGTARRSRRVDDLKGLKFRIGGLGGAILAKLGAVPQQIPPGEIYTSLERGLIDGAEWIGPYDDEKLGFTRWRSSTTRRAGGKAARMSRCSST